MESENLNGSACPSNQKADTAGYSCDAQRYQNGTSVRTNESSGEPIAIVGIGCRLPGGIDTPSKFWDVLIEGKSTQSPIPRSKFNTDGFYHPDPERPGSIAATGGYFLNQDTRQFDNDFFGINNLEATYMDPEQRILLEVVFECFENAGATLQSVSGADIGAYIGKFTYDYLLIQTKDPDNFHRYTPTGMSTAIIANRVSHVFNLQGPSVAMDTACSSSLYCLHTACSAIYNNDCDSAVVAGVNLIQSPEQHIATMKEGILSPTSTCHTFDEAADGYGRGEGVTAIYIKKLSKAIEDGDRIRSIIRATAVNSNGRTPGITLPSAVKQEAVIRKAYEKANLPPDQTDYVECHGTGTAVGDPIEVEAVSRVFQRSRHDPVLVGSVKPNFGHSEAASAITSIIKVTLALERGKIPATRGIKRINPKIDTDLWNVKIVTQNTGWPMQWHSSVRRASVNSFGFGGANAHAILEASNSHDDYINHVKCELPLELLDRKVLLPFSGATVSALRSRVSDLKSICERGVDIFDLAFTLATRRSTLRCRGFLTTSLSSLKDDFENQKLHHQNDETSSSPLPLTFVFNGQGAQWPQMGLDLLHEFSAFRNIIRSLDAVLQSLQCPPPWTIEGILSEPNETSHIHSAAYSQPICTGVQIALVQLLAEWNVKPAFVVGHSSGSSAPPTTSTFSVKLIEETGEICAAFTAGQLSAEEAILTAYFRGYACSQVITQGAMLATGVSHSAAMAAIETLELSEKVQVAGINSPENVTISGDQDKIEQLRNYFHELKFFARELKTDGKAYHSHHMLAVSRKYEELIIASAPLEPKKRQKTDGPLWISTVTGKQMISKIDPRYWRRNLEQSVRFSDAIVEIVELSRTHFVEIGPHSVLELPIKQVLSSLRADQSNCVYSSTLSRGKPGIETMLNLMGDLWIRGHEIPFSLINYVENNLLESRKCRNHVRSPCDLPNYDWNHEGILWNESRQSREYRERRYPRHDLLGSRVNGTGGSAFVWTNQLKVNDVLWLKNHRINEQIVFPAAGYIAMAMEAARQCANADLSSLPPCHLQDIKITKALVFSEEDAGASVEIHTTLHPARSHLNNDGKQQWYFTVASGVDGQVTTHTSGSLELESEPTTLSQDIAVKMENLEPQSVRTWYDTLSEAGLNFSGNFESLTEIHNSKDRSRRHTVAMTRPCQGFESSEESAYILHPSTIDGILHTSLIATAAGAPKNFRLRIPTAIDSIRIQMPRSFDANETIMIRGAAEPRGIDSMDTSVEVSSHQHETFMQIRKCRLIVPFHDQQRLAQERNPMLNVMWKPDITTMNRSDSNAFSAYLECFAPFSSTSTGLAGSKELFAALDLLTHKSPGLQIAAIHHEVSTHKELLDILHFDTAFKQCRSFAKATLTDDQTIHFQYASIESPGQYQYTTSTVAKKGSCDLLLLLDTTEVSSDLVKELQHFKHILSEKGLILGHFERCQKATLKQDGFTIDEYGISRFKSLCLARSPPSSESDGANSITQYLNGRDLVLVERTPGLPLVDVLETRVVDLLGHSVSRISFFDFKQSNLKAGSIVISTIELDQPIFAKMSEREFDSIKKMTSIASHLLWITGGSLLSRTQPEFAIASGLSRVVMLEEPALKFLTLDVDREAVTSQCDRTVSNILVVLEQGLRGRQRSDFEFIQDEQGTLHISRFAPERILNPKFRQKQGLEFVSMPLEELKPCQFMLEKSQQLDSAFFKGTKADNSKLREGWIEIDILSVDLESQSADVLTGKLETSHGKSVLQMTGIVASTSASVATLEPGDRVAALTLGHWVSKARVPEWACVKLEDQRGKGISTPVLSACSTALYALHHFLKVSHGQSILISSGASNIGTSAIIAAKISGADVFSTVSRLEEETFLVEKLEMSKDHILHVSDPCFAMKALTATSMQGFDRILVCSNDVLPPTLWKVCGDFGHLVRIAQLVGGDVPQLAQPGPGRGISSTTFSLYDLFNLENTRHQTIWARLLAESMTLFRESKLSSILPVKYFNTSQIKEAFQYVEPINSVGKACITFNDPKLFVRALPYKYDTTFNPNKTYLLVGCLGGLGRSISNWMFSQGARNFLFLGRSGLERQVARDFCENLQKKGAWIKVVRGDVTKPLDVESAVSEITSPLGGVIQGAMGLDESIFAEMSLQQWQSAIMPKVQGTWNIHNAIQSKEHQLDFFLMTSSISGSVGIATEGNYCASNHFLDIFARYRRRNGLRAISVGLGVISQIGYLHEHPDIQNGLVHKGASTIDADDFLQIIDTALSSLSSSRIQVGGNKSDSSSEDYYGHISKSHILTGLEPLGLNKLREQGFEGVPATFDDPRAALLSSALNPEGNNTNAFTTAGGSVGGMPMELIEGFHNSHNHNAKETTSFDMTLNMITKQLSNFLLTPQDKLDIWKPLAGFGMDSMLAAAVRAWFYKKFQVDVAFMTLLSQTATIWDLAQTVNERFLQMMGTPPA